MIKNTFYKKDNLQAAYNKINDNYNDFIIIANNRPVKTFKDVFYSHIIYKSGNFIRWQNFGSSANKNDYNNFKWIIDNIFKNCKYFYILPRDIYNAKINIYLYSEQCKRIRMSKNG